MNILAFDTATEVLCVAFRRRDGAFFENVQIAGFNHSERLIPAIDSLLDTAGIEPRDLDLVVCARGPGSFTGLRIGMATAKGIRAAGRCPIVSVSTLDAMAYRYTSIDMTVVPIIDARKQRVYAAVYQRGERIGDYLDTESSFLQDLVKGYDSVLFTGFSVDLTRQISAGVQGSRYDEALAGGLGFALCTLGERRLHAAGPDSNETGPMYLRKSDAETGKSGQRNG